MQALSHILAWFLVGWLGVLAAVIFIRVLRGDLEVRGMLRNSPSGRYDPERVAALGASLLVLGAYALEALNEGVVRDPQTGRPSMPDVSQTLLMIFASGNVTYLAGKLGRRD
jgi:hypothetical protein